MSLCSKHDDYENARCPACSAVDEETEKLQSENERLRIEVNNLLVRLERAEADLDVARRSAWKYGVQR